MLYMFTFAFAWSSWRIGRGLPDCEELQNLRSKLRLRITRIVQAIKVHEDIVIIDVSENSEYRFEAELLIPIISRIAPKYFSYNFLKYMESLCREEGLNKTLKVVLDLKRRARELINKS